VEEFIQEETPKESTTLADETATLLVDSSSRHVFQSQKGNFSGIDTGEIILAQGVVGQPVTSRYPQLNDIPPELEEHYALRGSVLIEVGQYAEAHKVFDTLIRNQRLRYGTNSPQVAETAGNLALTAEGLEDFKAAAGHYKEALEITEQLFKNKNDPEVVQYRNALTRMEKLVQASDFEKAWREYELPPELEQGHVIKAGEFLKARKYNEAEKDFKFVLRNQERNHSKISEEVVDTLSDLALTYELSGRNDEARQYYKQAIETGQKVYKDIDNWEVPKAQFGLARTELRAGNVPAYMDAIESALKAFEKDDILRFGSHTAKNVAQAHRVHAQVLEASGKNDLAKQQNTRAAEIDALIQKAEEAKKQEEFRQQKELENRTPTRNDMV